MNLALAQLPGLRGPDDSVYRGHVPTRARYMHPVAAEALLTLEVDTGGLVYTDVFRSPEASLAAMRTKRGVQPPGFSAHNFGLAVDLDLAATLKRLQLRYPELIDLMRDHGFFCHRMDLESSASESWHFNCLLPDPVRYLSAAVQHDRNSWSAPIERRIVDLYGPEFDLQPVDLQEKLSSLGFYGGAIDGQLGPLTREAVQAFQRAWCLVPDGVPGQRTMRTLAVVSSSRYLLGVA